MRGPSFVVFPKMSCMEETSNASRSCTPLPSEWKPTQWDISEANQVPDRENIQCFKVALLQSQDAQDCKPLLPATDDPLPGIGYLQSRQDMPTGQATYPLSLLSDLVNASGWDDVLERLKCSFSETFKRHVYLNELDLFSFSRKGIRHPTPLVYAQACMSSLVSRNASSFIHDDYSSSPLAESVNLFVLGVKLWIVTVEMDNRESRNDEMLLASSLLATYGLLSANPTIWDASRALLAYGTTILKRLQMSPKLGSCLSSPRSLHISYTFMVDVLSAAHFQTLPSLSTTELFLELPSSGYQFQQVYRQLLNSYEPLPSNIHSREDILLLLVALLCDIIYIQRNDLAHRMRSKDPPINPFTPLSRSRERERQQKLLSGALDCWHRHFGDNADQNILALFFFCKLVLSCPILPLLSCIAGYAVFPGSGLPSQDMVLASGSDQVSVSGDPVNYAWKVLDHVDVSQRSLDSQLPIWLPITLFSSALVVWQNLRAHSSSSRQYGSLKVLRTFIHELNQLPWGCCQVMSSVLQRLSVEAST
ncbi:uncharacterized protein N7498_000315 [Penicillium cinerascens]|uniref:Transcription factor domain-containing protein n=1 Tax=Penicillium cinerascens TaxID=70096 RepID=A0A9W9NE60_9EURO|nr:uncharacterized protein N7498_000315 [Penicillium cinerascens]KAJ5218216.1 hypothetical protein N7498_000315 [Penicillium cinerascens]